MHVPAQAGGRSSLRAGSACSRMHRQCQAETGGIEARLTLHDRCWVPAVTACVSPLSMQVLVLRLGLAILHDVMLRLHYADCYSDIDCVLSVVCGYTGADWSSYWSSYWSVQPQVNTFCFLCHKSFHCIWCDIHRAVQEHQERQQPLASNFGPVLGLERIFT